MRSSRHRSRAALIYFIMSAPMIFGPESAHAARMSPSALVQYQYSVDVPACNINLTNGIRIEFSGVFANENGDIVFEEITTFRIPTNESFRFSSMVKISHGFDIYDAKVVKLEPGFVSFAIDASFLSEFWGSEESFTIYNTDNGAYNAHINFALPADPLPARIAISRGRTCQTGALNTD